MTKPPSGPWVDEFMRLGRPAGDGDAYCDLDPDTVVFNDHGVLITAGDVRALQRHLMGLGVRRKDRLTTLMKEMPTLGGEQ